MFNGARLLVIAAGGLAIVGLMAWFLFGGGHPSCEPHQSLSWLKC